MPLYTVRVRMEPTIASWRGASYCEMTHHLHWDTDGAAIDALPDLVGAWNDSGITSRWCCKRGVDAHLITIYRRDIADERSWTYVTGGYFSLPDFFTFGFSISVSGVPVTVDMTETPMFPYHSGAVLVTERSGITNVQRRVYVGPVSATPMIGRTAVGADLIQLQLVNPFNGDFPFDPETDTLDVWRDDIRDLARDHCANIEDRAGDGYSVVASWKAGIVEPVLQTYASSTRAEIRSRRAASQQGPGTAG